MTDLATARANFDRIEAAVNTYLAIDPADRTPRQTAALLTDAVTAVKDAHATFDAIAAIVTVTTAATSDGPGPSAPLAPGTPLQGPTPGVVQYTDGSGGISVPDPSLTPAQRHNSFDYALAKSTAEAPLQKLTAEGISDPAAVRAALGDDLAGLALALGLMTDPGNEPAWDWTLADRWGGYWGVGSKTNDDGTFTDTVYNASIPVATRTTATSEDRIAFGIANGLNNSATGPA